MHLVLSARNLAKDELERNNQSFYDAVYIINACVFIVK